MKATKITRVDLTSDKMWVLYKKERDGRMKERYHAIALMLEGKTPPAVAKMLHLARNSGRPPLQLHHKMGSTRSGENRICRS
ncbi:MAG: hypothetical protein ACTSUE_20575 [Promethearchaeota archaeon]